MSYCGIYFKIIHVRQKGYFHRPCITFLIGYFKRHRTTSQEKQKLLHAIHYQVMQYTVLNKECINFVKPEIPVPRINQPIFKCALLTLKQFFFDFGCFKTIFYGIFCPPNMHNKVPINDVTADVNVVTRY